jgi:hypothetical protein
MKKKNSRLDITKCEVQHSHALWAWPQGGNTVTSVTPRRTPTDSEQDFGNRLNHYPHFTSFPFPISSHVLSQLLIHNLPSLLPYLRIVTTAEAVELLPSINT